MLYLVRLDMLSMPSLPLSWWTQSKLLLLYILLILSSQPSPLSYSSSQHFHLLNSANPFCRTAAHQTSFIPSPPYEFWMNGKWEQVFGKCECVLGWIDLELQSTFLRLCFGNTIVNSDLPGHHIFWNGRWPKWQNEHYKGRQMFITWTHNLVTVTDQVRDRL